VSEWSQIGAVFTYERVGSTYTPWAQVLRGFKHEMHFGRVARISGDGLTLLVGSAWSTNLAIVYTRPPGGKAWTEQAVLRTTGNPTIRPQGLCSSSGQVSHDGEYVACSGEIGGIAEIYVWRCARTSAYAHLDSAGAPSNCTFYATLRQPNYGSTVSFGQHFSMDASGDTIAIGAWGMGTSYNVGGGAVIVFRRDTQRDTYVLAATTFDPTLVGSCNSQQASGTEACITGNNYGQSLALSGDGTTLVSGSWGTPLHPLQPVASRGSTLAGEAYIYDLTKLAPIYEVL
jgi:hypothetical protein